MQHAHARIEKLVVDNFKSYSGRHEIGPFDKFTCIIGPNGSGKSNIMDAISFCLGIKTKHLRGERLKDLVYRKEDESVDANPRHAEVTLAFRSSSGKLLYFGRVVTSRGEGIYRFGTDMASMSPLGYEDYSKRLADENIFVRARSFLVFQGDVMQLARRQGGELTSTLEALSGSELLKDKYAQLSKELEVAQEKARLHFQHRREAETTLALLASQRAEVKKFQDLKAQRDNLLVEGALFRLYCAERDATQTMEASAGLRKEAAEAEAELKARRKIMEDADAQRLKLESEFREAQNAHFALNAALEQRKPEIASCRKQAAHWTIKEREVQAKIQAEEQHVKNLEDTWKQAVARRSAAEEELGKIQSRTVESALKLTPEQRQEYDQAVLKTEQLNLKARDKLREAEEKLVKIMQEVNSNKEDLREREEKRGKVQAKMEDLQREKGDMEISLETCKVEIQQTKRQMAKLEEEVKTFATFRTSLSEEKQALQFEVDSVKARRDQLEALESKQRVADELRGRFPDLVLGRISELLLPTQKRFDLPLQMALGAMSEALVVKDISAAQQCVQHLKEGRMASETFLPLDRMDEPQAASPHELTDGKAGRRLATVCVQHNEKFLQRQEVWRESGPAAIDRTVNFLLKGVIITDTLEQARQTSYVDAKKKNLLPRVVTLDGEVIAPNRNMSVKASAASRVEFGGAEQLRQLREKEVKLQQVTKDLATLQEEAERKTLQANSLSEEVARKESEQGAVEPQLKQLASLHTARAKELKKMAKQVEDMTNRVSQGEAAFAAVRKEKEGLEGELVKLGKAHFKTLNAQLGVDVREVMLKEEREKQQLRAEVERYEDYLRRVSAEASRAEQRFRSSHRLTQLKQDLSQYQRDHSFAEHRLAELEELQSKAATEVQAASDRVRKAKEQKETFETSNKTGKTDIVKLKVQSDDAKKRLKRQNDKVKTIFGIMCAIFRECRDRGIDVPLRQRDSAALDKVLEREQEVDDMPLKDLEAACRSVKVNFSVLPEDKKELAEDALNTKTVESEYAEQVAEITRELEELNPNMRALQECEVEESKLKEIRREADRASLESQRLLREFESVKADRVARFMKCFKHIEEKVNPYYKELTAYDGYEGGSAYLDLDDAEEPYNGGITFTACPPGKRFFPMELLSGGERSMASMALLFALHSYQPPPFMILDEVDAPFDRKNTGSLVNYLKRLKFQCVVISLKDTFFSHSDSIVGVYKDKAQQSSGILSLSLRLGKLADEAQDEDNAELG